jgi:NAD(P)-dependent dehydrogenase (short-subunit alcohol dehydrogenase family)
MMNRDNPVWLITGCSTGFGRELAKLVLERGWRALVLPLDVTQHAQVEAAVAQAKERFGRVDVLVNNAGYGYLAAIEEGEDAAVREMFEANVFGLVDMTKAVLPIMRKQTAARSGNQAGDPVRAAQAIIDAALSDSPPLRLLLGKAALELARKKLDFMRKDFDTWEATTVGADFPEGTQ